MAQRKASFLAFFLAWATFKGWQVPDIHIRACHWLEHRQAHAVLRIFRGAGKSTILAVYNAWRYWQDPAYRILHQGDQDKTAYKTSRDTQAVLRRHPWTADWAKGIKGEASFWWAPGADDQRNPSMQAAGITSNITSSRCDEAQNDDVEVPRNIQNPEAREKMRYRLGEQVHIMVPGARLLFVGTPHTHDSIYDEHEAMGADCLTIRMFAQEQRIEGGGREHRTKFKPEIVFAGIGKGARWLREGVDYTLGDGVIRLREAPVGMVDLYAGCAWPERFTPEELFSRRQKTRTINEWDSQYQLHSRPMHEIRLDPARIQAYDCEPRFVTQNRILTMWLGATQIVGCSLRWDPSSGKLGSDVSAVVLDLQDANGRHYWHRMEALAGEIAETSDDGSRITGGQVWQLADIVERFKVPRVTIETNGVGVHAPAFVRTCFKQRRIQCGVVEVQASVRKEIRILEALEPLMSSGMLWAHVDVLNGPMWDQMRDWNPAETNQPDDYLDAGAGAVTDQPARIGQTVRIESASPADDWRPSGAVTEYALSDD